jgi:hypothetical protein
MNPGDTTGESMQYEWSQDLLKRYFEKQLRFIALNFWEGEEFLPYLSYLNPIP